MNALIQLIAEIKGLIFRRHNSPVPVKVYVLNNRFGLKK
jgi:hypothetical protein